MSKRLIALVLVIVMMMGLAIPTSAYSDSSTDEDAADTTIVTIDDTTVEANTSIVLASYEEETDDVTDSGTSGDVQGSDTTDEDLQESEDDLVTEEQSEDSQLTDDSTGDTVSDEEQEDSVDEQSAEDATDANEVSEDNQENQEADSNSEDEQEADEGSGDETDEDAEEPDDESEDEDEEDDSTITYGNGSGAASVWGGSVSDVTLTSSYHLNLLAIAQTQLGYTEAASGYTIYGDWYGIPYGDWCAMFVSYCLYYAGVTDFPYSAGCGSFVSALASQGLYASASSGYIPTPGDIVFFDWDGDGSANHVGIVAALSTEYYGSLSYTAREGALANSIATLQASLDGEDVDTSGDYITIITIEGNYSDRVQTVAYAIDSECILGYGLVPAYDESYDQDNVDAFINNYLTYEDVEYPFTEEEIAAFEAFLSLEEITDESQLDDSDYYVFCSVYGHSDQIASGEEDWESLSVLEQAAVNAVIAEYYEIVIGDGEADTYEDMLASAKHILDVIAGISETWVAIYEEMNSDDPDMEVLESLGLVEVTKDETESTSSSNSVNSGILMASLDDSLYSDTGLTGTVSGGTSMSYPSSYSSSITTRVYSLAIDDDTVYKGLCVQPTLNNPTTGERQVYQYTQLDAFAASVLANSWLNGTGSSAANHNEDNASLDYESLWESDGGISKYLISCGYAKNTNMQFVFRHEASAYLLWGAWKAADGGYNCILYNGSDYKAIVTSTEYIADNYTNYDFSDSSVYIVFPDSDDLQITAYAAVGVALGAAVANVDLSLTKASNSSYSYLTNSNSNYSLAGTVYGIYTDSSCSTLYARVTFNASGAVSSVSANEGSTSGTVSLDANSTYYVKEITAGTGYTLDSTVYTITTGTDDLSYTLYDTPKVAYISLTKAIDSASQSIIDSAASGAYSLDGTKYGIYTNSACTSTYLYATVTFNSDGSVKSISSHAGSGSYASMVQVAVGTTYYIKEITAGTGFELDSTVYSITTGTSANAVSSKTLTDSVTTKSLKLTKVCDSNYTDLISGNTCYDLAGTTYGVYTSSALASAGTTSSTSTAYAIVVFNSDGSVNVSKSTNVHSDGTVPVAINTTYYLKELVAGTGYTLSSTVTSVAITTTDKSVTLSDIPGTDPAYIQLTKTGVDGTVQKSLAGAVFSITYYGGFYSSESAAEAAASAGVEKRTWYVQTVEFYGYYIARFSFNNSFISDISDDLYYLNGVVRIPYGTLIIKEVSAAEGYLNDPVFTDSTGNSYGDVFITWATENETFKSAFTGNSIDPEDLTVTDTLIPELHTTLTSSNGTHVSQANSSVTVTDTISMEYLNDYIGKTVTVKGYLMFADGTPVTVNGVAVTATTQVTITGTEQTVTQTFTLDASLLEGQSTVAFEEFIYNNEVIAEHEDLEDEGQTVYFIRQDGSITITKMDSYKNPLAGATYLLEYSTDDGETWVPVYSYTDGETSGYVAGGCSSDGLVDGTLTTGSDGIVAFTGLLADGSILYRLTEVAAPNGYTLMTESVFEGTLPYIDEDTDISAYDVNGDGKANISDFNTLFEYVSTGASTGDVNGDGSVDAADLEQLLAFLNGQLSVDVTFDLELGVVNGVVLTMPAAGSNGFSWLAFASFGILGMAGAFGLGWFVWRRKKGLTGAK